MAKAPSKLFKLKEWHTIDQASTQLSVLLDETITKADIYQLALDRKITISILFPNGANARIGKIVDYDQVEKRQMPNLDGNGFIEVCNAIRIDNFFKDDEYGFTPSLLLEDEIKQIGGIWDLAMCGAERLDIDHALLQEISDLESNWVNTSGTFIRHGDVWASLQAEFTKGSFKGGHYPAGGIGDFDHILVIKPTALMDFVNLLSDEQRRPKGRPSILTEDQIGDIKKLHEDKPELTAGKIANTYGVSDSKIRQVWI
jgi:hypothetical protein